MSKRSRQGKPSAASSASTSSVAAASNNDDSGEWEDPALFDLLEQSGATTTSAGASDGRRLSEYERLREENIKKNMEMLSQLGIEQVKPQA